MLFITECSAGTMHGSWCTIVERENKIHGEYEVSLMRSNDNITFNEKLSERITLFGAENASFPFLVAFHKA